MGLAADRAATSRRWTGAPRDGSPPCSWPALSMQGREDAERVHRRVRRRRPYIVDYLAEEVLARQPADVRDFLLRTSHPRAAHRPAVRRRHRAAAAARRRLVALERANLFLVPLDDRRQWYRYHHLFADVLRAHLLDEQPGEVAELHRRASAWFEANGDTTQAISHALAGGDSDRAADLMELAMPRCAGNGGRPSSPAGCARCPTTWCGPGRCSASRSSARWRRCRTSPPSAERLSDIERCAAPGRRPVAGAAAAGSGRRRRGRLPVAPRQHRDVPGRAGTRATATWTAPSRTRGRRCRWRRRATTSSGPRPARWPGSRPGPRATSPARTPPTPSPSPGCGSAGFVADVLGCCITLGDIRADPGPARRRPGHVPSGPSTWPRRAGGRCGERPTCTSASRGCCSSATTSPAAAEHLATSRAARRAQRACRRTRTGGGWCWPGSGRPRATSTRRSSCSTRRTGSTTATTPRTCGPSRRCGPGCGSVAASSTTRPPGRGSGSCPPTTSCPTCASTSTSPSRGSCSPSDADDTATRSACSNGCWRRRGRRARRAASSSVLVLLALAHGDRPAALGRAAPRRRRSPSRRATSACSPTRAPVMATLLGGLAEEPTYVRRLRAAAARSARPASGELIEPLSRPRARRPPTAGTDLDGPDIARRLHVSLNTMRTHSRNIFRKLEVTSRRAAVRRAAELDLIPGSPSRSGTRRG